MPADVCVIMSNCQSNREGRLQVHWPCAHQLSGIGRPWLASVCPLPGVPGQTLGIPTDKRLQSHSKNQSDTNGTCMAASWLPIALNWRIKSGQRKDVGGKLIFKEKCTGWLFLSIKNTFCPCPMKQKSGTNLFLLITRTRVKLTIHDCFSVSPH